METKVIESRQWTLNARDFIRGLVMAVLGAVVTIIYESFKAGNLEFDWKKIGYVAAATAIAYIFKNFVEPSKVIAVKGSGETTESLAKNIKRVV